MRKASTRKHLIIALEPECASLHVRAQKDQHGATKSIKYGIVDCGGGTVDIVYHSLEENDDGSYFVSELIPPSGGPYGGTCVDVAFEQLLEPVFHRGKCLSFFGELKKSYTPAWLNLMKQLEEKKSVLDEKEDEDPVWFDLSLQFNTACQEITGRGALSLLEESQVKGIKLSEETEQLQVQAGLIKGLYSSAIEKICMCLKEKLKEESASTVGTLYMVGTFSTSQYLLDSVKNSMASLVPRERVFNPPESSLAVVKGAVMYGINPSILQERVAAKSYGIRCLREFDSTKHPEEKAEVHNGKKYCAGIYSEFIARGQKLRTGGVTEITHVPVKPDQKNIWLRIYCATTTVTYVDDDGCYAMADLTVPMPDITGGLNRQVLTEIEFSGTELHVVATDETTGKSCDGSIEFIYE